MTYLLRLTVVFLTIALLFPATSNAQVRDFSYRSKITITELENVSRTNYPVKITVDTRALVAAGKMLKGGNDLRFADSCFNTPYDFFIESGMNTKKTNIWIKIPKLDAKGSLDIYMFYGRPGSIGASSVSSVFSTSFVSSNRVTRWKGTQNYDYIHIKSTDSIYIDDTARLILNSKIVTIDGYIKGIGAGEDQGTTAFAKGKGPGGGLVSFTSSAGAGGGAYGGDGGDGGYDTGDSIGLGGKSYGTEKGQDIAIGSNGGSGASYGANGGGCVIINADIISIGGEILVDGDHAVNGASTGQMGGGGSGGGIKIVGSRVSVSGTLSAQGGDGGPGVGAANDSGGGGGGGRIKIFYENSFSNTGKALFLGGDAGPYGGVSAEDGDTGTFYVEQTGKSTSAPYSFSVSSNEDVIKPVISASNSICEGDSLVVSVQTGFSSYVFSQSGTVLQTSNSNTYTYKGLSNLDVIKVTAAYNSCLSFSDSIVVTVYPAPKIQFAGDTAVCTGDSATIEIFGLDKMEWLDGIGTRKIVTVAIAKTTYFRALGENARGCKNIDSTKVTAYELPNVIINGDRAICIGNGVKLTVSGAQNYLWNNGNISDEMVYRADTLADTSFSVVGTDAKGCKQTASINLTVNDLPTLSIVGDNVHCAGDSVKLSVSGATTYSWTSGSSTDTEKFIAKNSRTINVTGTDDNGCVSSTQQSITVNDRPTASITGDTLVCEGESTKLSATGGMSYEWNTTDESSEIEVSPTKLETYSVIVADGNGCKDTAAHSVDQLVLDASFSESTNLLTANADDVSYLWLDCDKGKLGIAGAKDKEYEITKSGNFALQVSKLGCKAISDCSEIEYVGIDNAWSQKITVFPNPSNGVFEVVAPAGELVRYEIFSSTGERVAQSNFNNRTTIELHELPSGVFTLVMSSDNKRAVKLLMKQ